MSKPIKRSEHITQLSREHHITLLFCWKLRSGLKKNIDLERLVNYIKYFWKNHLLLHFSEENILFAPVNDELVQTAYHEHHEINELIERVISTEQTCKPEDILEIANLVDKHVRFEERELFPHLEREIHNTVLKKIGEILRSMQPEPLQDTFEDEFWKN